MSGVLVLDRQMVYGDLDRLRNAIASHTESEETAAELVAVITVARAFGAIAYVTLLPSNFVADGLKRIWKLRVRHDPMA